MIVPLFKRASRGVDTVSKAIQGKRDRFKARWNSLNKQAERQYWQNNSAPEDVYVVELENGQVINSYIVSTDPSDPYTSYSVDDWIFIDKADWAEITQYMNENQSQFTQVF